MYNRNDFDKFSKTIEREHENIPVPSLLSEVAHKAAGHSAPFAAFLKVTIDLGKETNSMGHAMAMCSANIATALFVASGDVDIAMGILNQAKEELAMIEKKMNEVLST